MSTEAVANFLSKVATDQSLQSELGKALEADNDREAVTTLAKSKGYDFSSDELWAEVQKRQAEFQAKVSSKEMGLSDEELEAVAGGGTPFVTIVSAAKTAEIASAVAGSAGLSIAVSQGIGDKIQW